MMTTFLLAAFLAAPDAAQARDPFAGSGQRLTLESFDLAPAPSTKPSPFPQLDPGALVSGLEWWAVEEDWGQAVTDAAPALATLASRQNQRIIYSALLCQSVQLLTSPDDHSTEAARKRLVAIGLLATERLEKARIVPLACDAWPVARLVGCLGLLPGAECKDDPKLAELVAAAERIAP